jgi:hypothetical protein
MLASFIHCFSKWSFRTVNITHDEKRAGVIYRIIIPVVTLDSKLLNSWSLKSGTGSDAVLIMMELYAKFSYLDLTGRHIIRFQWGWLVAPGATIGRFGAVLTEDTCVREYQSTENSNQETMQRCRFGNCKLLSRRKVAWTSLQASGLRDRSIKRHHRYLLRMWIIHPGAETAAVSEDTQPIHIANVCIWVPLQANFGTSSSTTDLIDVVRPKIFLQQLYWMRG